MNGEHFLIYTTEEGGIFKVLGRSTPEEFAEVRESGEIPWRRLHPDWDSQPADAEPTKLALAVLVEVQDHWDFVLNGRRLTAENLAARELFEEMSL